ncbi:uncharacterized protein LOC135820572 [Sycon ciliatum]|uniref:uncharacterized protein LOC135820572 n=1 Tax=Sycon ciliatum TaxID=27933 RepID=UPI0031F6CD7D
MGTGGTRRAVQRLSHTMLLALVLAVVLCCSSSRAWPIACLRRNVFVPLREVFQYDCSSRGYASFPPIPQSDREQTYILHLENNQLHISDSQAFAHFNILYNLYMSNSEIPHLMDGLFDPLVKLHSLDLSKSQIQTVGPNVFANLHHLVQLNMSGNKIQLLPPNVFRGLSYSAAINLKGNPLVQDYRLCGALYNQYTPHLYLLDTDVVANLGSGSFPQAAISVNHVCSRQCNTWRPDFLKVCPNAFCKGTVANHQCLTMDSHASLYEVCPNSLNILRMFSSKEGNFWDSRNSCRAMGASTTLPSEDDFQKGCVGRLLAKVRQQYNLDYTPVVWLGELYLGRNAYASDGKTYPLATGKLYYMCSTIQ